MIILQYFEVEKAITKSQLVEKSNTMGSISCCIVSHLLCKCGFMNVVRILMRKLLLRYLITSLGYLTGRQKKDFPCLSYFAKGMFRDENNQHVFKNITSTPMELKILELPPEYDPPCPINNKEREKVDTCLSPLKKKSRQTVTPIQNKTTPRVISKQPCLRKSPRRANVAKRPKSPLPKRKAKKHANVPSYTGIKQNVEIKSSVAFEIPSTSKSHDFSISRAEFDQFKLFRNFIGNNFKVVLNFIKTKYAEDKGDGVEVTNKVSVGVVQSKNLLNNYLLN
ncbi:hypothetical protein H5410_009580 [Solanum commersonii]|uniref:Uncharacterized protein n=1 Tax=Solanum commersonii TaxID=4109 RepID=A0A9J6AJY7_SOLCO|nr:hypothetical protein H5410_009580 [Solanum commersonii]